MLDRLVYRLIDRPATSCVLDSDLLVSKLFLTQLVSASFSHLRFQFVSSLLIHLGYSSFDRPARELFAGPAVRHISFSSVCLSHRSACSAGQLIVFSVWLTVHLDQQLFTFSVGERYPCSNRRLLSFPTGKLFPRCMDWRLVTGSTDELLYCPSYFRTARFLGNLQAVRPYRATPVRSYLRWAGCSLL